ncbi:MAG TPA: MBL fold metallo-hydrolase, partial [Candidatus Coprosoma intestinipullorum]|nr:MBL fold metallo-hydrolase [Candidatus Coprosoma intestinipullorum]
YYIAGDTDALLENEDIICEVAMVPIGGTYTMDAREAAEFVNKMKPKVVVPYHYGMVVGTEDDFKLFASLVDSSITVQRAYEKN